LPFTYNNPKSKYQRELKKTFKSPSVQRDKLDLRLNKNLRMSGELADAIIQKDKLDLRLNKNTKAKGYPKISIKHSLS
jgi:hypothetical protein